MVDLRKPASRKRRVLLGVGGGTGALVLAVLLWFAESQRAQRILCGAARGACAEIAPVLTAPVPAGLISGDHIPSANGCPPGASSLGSQGCWWRLPVRAPGCIEGVTWEGPDDWCYAPALRLAPEKRRPSVLTP